MADAARDKAQRSLWGRLAGVHRCVYVVNQRSFSAFRAKESWRILGLGKGVPGDPVRSERARYPGAGEGIIVLYTWAIGKRARGGTKVRW